MDNGDMATEVDGIGCDHHLKCVNCTATGTDAILCNHTSDSRRCPARLSKYGTARSYERKAEKTENPWKIVIPAQKPVPKAKSKGKGKTKAIPITYDGQPLGPMHFEFRNSNMYGLLDPDEPHSQAIEWNGQMLNEYANLPDAPPPRAQSVC
jgi:hypothetical protein